MEQDFNQQLEEIRGGTVKFLNLYHDKIGDNGARALSMALMNENNKVISIDLTFNKLEIWSWCFIYGVDERKQQSHCLKALL